MKAYFQRKALLLSAICGLAIFSCGRPDTVNTLESMNTSPDGVLFDGPHQLDSSTYGTYRGVLPCAECGAKQIILQLLEDDSYELLEVHKDAPEKICRYNGDLKYNGDTKTIRLPMEDEDPSFEILKGTLQLLDAKGQRVVTKVSETPYLFKSSLDLQNALWKVVSIRGESIGEQDTNRTFLQFMADESISYTMGCNNCRGNYKSVAPGEIYFKMGMCTKKMCGEIDWEYKMSQALNESSTFVIKGKDLIFRSSKGEVTITFTSFL